MTCLGQYNAATHTQMHFQNQPRGFLTTLPPAPPGLEGNSYIHEEWNSAVIYLTDSTKLSDINVRIDVIEGLVEIEYDKEIKVLPVSRILAISLKRNNGTEEYVNGSTLGIGNFYNYLLQVVHGDTVMLLSRIHGEIVHANNNPHPMLDTGEKNDKIILKKSYIIVKGKEFVNVAGKGKFKDDMERVFGTEVDSLIDKINTKKENDLVLLVKKLNGLKS